MSVKDGEEYLPIEEKGLEQHRARSNAYLRKVKYSPKGSMAPQKTKPSSGWIDPSVMNKLSEMSILEIAKAISADEELLKEAINRTLLIVRKGLRIGLYLAELYERASGLESLIARNKQGGGISESEKSELNAKVESSSAVAAFCSAYYIVWELSSYRTEELSAIKAEAEPIPEITLTKGPLTALDGMIYYYGDCLLNSGIVVGEMEFAKMTMAYFTKFLDAIVEREGALKYVEIFTGKRYNLVGSEFLIKGFEVQTAVSGGQVEIKRVVFEEIVGNLDSKHAANRLIQRLLCYCFTRKMNPMLELGGLPLVTLGAGKPGTGKSMIIAATATKLEERCRDLGYPFLFRPMPDTLVSKFQGDSDARTMEWLNPLKDPTRIVYCPVDDAEKNFEDRSREHSSEGNKGVVSVFLRFSEGASAVHKGNAVIQFFTNLPELIDPAVLSRIVKRTYINGATTREDFLDQDYLWYKRFIEIDPGFINMAGPGDYKFMQAQEKLKSLSELYSEATKPSEEKIRAIYDRTGKSHDLNSHDFFAFFFLAVQQEFPRFSSRDIRNIQLSVNERIMDFDFDESWEDDPNLFYLKDYDTKMNMLKELIRVNMKGLSFAEIRIRETISYLDNMIKITTAGEKRKLDEMVRDMRLKKEAYRIVEADKS